MAGCQNCVVVSCNSTSEVIFPRSLPHLSKWQWGRETVIIIFRTISQIARTCAWFRRKLASCKIGANCWPFLIMIWPSRRAWAPEFDVTEFMFESYKQMSANSKSVFAWDEGDIRGPLVNSQVAMTAWGPGHIVTRLRLPHLALFTIFIMP